MAEGRSLRPSFSLPRPTACLHNSHSGRPLRTEAPRMSLLWPLQLAATSRFPRQVLRSQSSGVHSPGFQ